MLELRVFGSCSSIFPLSFRHDILLLTIEPVLSEFSESLLKLWSTVGADGVLTTVFNAIA
jgi:hypothetical protein